jgi:hypothetical protein
VSHTENQPAHSKIGASSMKRWANCPGSVKLSEGIPNVSSKYAAEGTEAHTWGEKVLRGENVPSSIPASMREAVMVYVDYVRGMLADHGVGDDEFTLEQRFDLSAIYPGLFGTADCVMYLASRKQLVVVDYKHGAGLPVEVADEHGPNVQLMYYATGAAHSPQFKDKPIDTVKLVVVQPRCQHEDGPVREVVVDSLDLLSFAHELAILAANTQKENAPLVPGKWCKDNFCPAAGICPALHSQANEVAARQFDNHLTDPELLADTLSKLPVVEAWVKSVREHAYQAALRGEKIPGFKLVQKRATRRWADEAQTLRALKDMQFSEKDIFELKLKSPAQIEKILPKGLKNELKTLTVSESSGTTLVPDSDKRAVARPDVETQFTVITDETE